MNRIKLFIIASCSIICLNNTVLGQLSNVLLVLHEGRFGGMGEVGYLTVSGWGPRQYERIHYIEPYGSMLYKNNNYEAFSVGGNGTIYRYRLDWVGPRVADSISGTNARALAVWYNNLLITSTVKPYFRVYDLNNNQLLYTLDSTKVRNISDGIEIVGNKAFISLGYYKDSTVTVIDLVGRDTLKNIRTVFNPNNLVFRNGAIWVECLDSFGKSLQFQRIDTTTLSVTNTYNTGIPSGASGITADNDSLIYFVNGKTNNHIATFNYSTAYVDSFKIKSPNNYGFYGLNFGTNVVLDTFLYCSTAPTFSDTGWVRYYDHETKQFSDSIRTAISPRSVLHIETSISSTDEELEKINTKIYPNPISNRLNILADKSIQHIEIHSIDGKIIKSVSVETVNTANQKPMSDLLKGIETINSTTDFRYAIIINDIPNGLYFLTVKGLEGIGRQKIIISK